MKRIIDIILVTIITILLTVVVVNSTSVIDLSKYYLSTEIPFVHKGCKLPLAYKVGIVSQQFNLSEDNIISILNDAEKIWEDEIGKNIFSYEPDNNKAIPVNFIFDERQQELILQLQSQQIIERQWNTYEDLVDGYNNLLEKNKKRVNTYDKAVTLYDKKLEQYNLKVNEWNKGGGNKNEYNALLKERESLDREFKSLEAERVAINKNVEELNKMSNSLENIHNRYSNNTEKYNREYVDGETIEIGLFEINEINIYQYKNVAELKVTLAHELGHALGLGHVEGERSLMYYLNTNQDSSNPSLSFFDKKELNDVCNL